MTGIEYKRLSATVDLTAMRAELTPERRSAADAMRLHMLLTCHLTDAIVERDQNAYRRTLRAFRKAARRVERRYNAVEPSSRPGLGNIHLAPARPRPQQEQEQPANQRRAA